MAIILLAAAAIIPHREALIMAESTGKTVNENCIVIDAGHGGDDPGKIGINGTLEKDINLIIAHKLKTLLESQDYEVVMTRSTGEGLYQKGTRNMKVEDMQKRCGIITDTMPVFTVSIHQNSYPEKANESYYLLKKTPTPTVIVECGFLSNREEAELLNTEAYQDKVAWAVMMGIVQYLNEPAG